MPDTIFEVAVANGGFPGRQPDAPTAWLRSCHGALQQLPWYVLGNYSFFVRPNYKRVALSGADNLSEVAATAYLSPDGKHLVAVYVNNTFEKQSVEVALPKAFRKQIASSKMYITDERNDLSLHEMADATAFSINARSVTTVVYNLK